MIDFRKTVHEAERGREKHLCKGGEEDGKKDGAARLGRGEKCLYYGEGEPKQAGGKIRNPPTDDKGQEQERELGGGSGKNSAPRLRRKRPRKRRKKK